MSTLLTEALPVKTGYVICGTPKPGHGTRATRTMSSETITSPGPLDLTLAPIS